MADLRTYLMGLQLQNPIMIGASGLTSMPDGVEKAAHSGVGAIVLKSLFEEQILAVLGQEMAGLDLNSHPDAEAFISRTAWEDSTDKYLKLISESKRKVDTVPIIASINCVGQGRWADFAGRIEEAGADALELNIAYVPFSPQISGQEIEKRVLSTVKEARSVTKLPIMVKLGNHYSSLPYLVHGLSKEGANAAVIFNRFFRFDFNLSTMRLSGAQPLSSETEYHESLRWTSILYKRVGLEIVSSTGIHSADAAIKCLLAGASAVEVCSVIYKQGWGIIGTMLKDMNILMDSLGYSCMDSLQGKLATINADRPEEYHRLQYIKALTDIY